MECIVPLSIFFNSYKYFLSSFIKWDPHTSPSCDCGLFLHSCSPRPCSATLHSHAVVQMKNLGLKLAIWFPLKLYGNLPHTCLRSWKCCTVIPNSKADNSKNRVLGSAPLCSVRSRHKEEKNPKTDMERLERAVGLLSMSCYPSEGKGRDWHLLQLRNAAGRANSETHCRSLGREAPAGARPS